MKSPNNFVLAYIRIVDEKIVKLEVDAKNNPGMASHYRAVAREMRKQNIATRKAWGIL